MAAWSDHETWDKAGKSSALSTPSKPQTEMPACWDFFTDEALIQLLADASSEFGRRGKGIRVMVG